MLLRHGVGLGSYIATNLDPWPANSLQSMLAGRVPTLRAQDCKHCPGGIKRPQCLIPIASFSTGPIVHMNCQRLIGRFKKNITFVAAALAAWTHRPWLHMQHSRNSPAHHLAKPCKTHVSAAMAVDKTVNVISSCRFVASVVPATLHTSSQPPTLPTRGQHMTALCGACSNHVHKHLPAERLHTLPGSTVKLTATAKRTCNPPC